MKRKGWRGGEGAGRQDVTPAQPPALLQGGGSNDAFTPHTNYSPQHFQNWAWDFPAGSVAKSLPINTGDSGSTPGAMPGS